MIRWMPHLRSSSGCSMAALVAPAILMAQGNVRPLPSLQGALVGWRVENTAFREFRPAATNGLAEFSSKVARLPPAVFSNGTVALSDVSSIVLFDRTGRFLSRVGRRGGGPGEFGGLSLDGLCVVHGDTLVAFSSTDRRVTAFRRDGKLAGTWPYPEGMSVASTGCFRDGTAVFKSSRLEAVGTDHPVAAASVGHFSGTHRLRPIGPIPVLSSLGGVREAFVLPYTNGTTVTANGTEFGFAVMPSNPSPSRIFRSRDHPLPYTSADHAAFIRNSIPESATGKQREMYEASMRTQASPKSWPTLAGMLVDAASGDVWLRLFSRDHLVQDWVVVTPASRRVAKVLLPDAARAGKWRLLAVNGTSLTVEWHDDDDIPHVGLFRVRPAPRR